MIRLSALALGMMVAMTGAQVTAANAIKPHHQEAGLNCKSCHQSAPFEPVGMEQCLNCHALPEQKSDYHGAPDKHDSPHYGVKLECENCHFEHEESENYCANCHDFEFNVP
ncbi:cytochrome c3 [Ferrimonas sediminicola]|uniref:Cytochrome c3 n=1 Tax=Ferrimonas sediminicola TaxID=2569538 RepID=A0A4U1B8D2_9GAMM|nr:cytochrome c3 family protein [Ferrimonas sediminicola]TKB46205.1 cytochrome c3 [Ferrimonas sediminicola]